MTDLLDVLAEHTNWELHHGPLDGDMSDCAWQVHSVNGGYNDREWTLLATGDTPRGALVRALRVGDQLNDESEPETCIDTDIIDYDALVRAPAVTTRAMVTYRHKQSKANTEVRFAQYASDPLPEWAVDVQPHVDPDA